MNDSSSLPSDGLVRRMTQFRDKTKKEGNIDVYWLYDDGGLTLLLPHILSTRSKFARCSLRVFFLSSSKRSREEWESESRSMAALLREFRIEFGDVVMLTDATRRPERKTRDEFRRMARMPGQFRERMAMMSARRRSSGGLRFMPKSASASSLESASSAEAVRSRNSVITDEDLSRYSLS